MIWVGSKEDGGWAPSEDDVKRIEAALPAEAKARMPELGRPIAEYLRQYVGVTQDGKRLVRIHGVHKSAATELDLTKRELMVLDGGNEYFEGIYDPATGIFSDLGPHGDA